MMVGLELIDDTIVGCYMDENENYYQVKVYYDDSTNSFLVSRNFVTPNGRVPIIYPPREYNYKTSQISDDESVSNYRATYADAPVRKLWKPAIPVKFLNKYVLIQNKAFINSFINNDGFLVSDNADVWADYQPYSENPIQFPFYSLSSIFGKLNFNGKEILILGCSNQNNQYDIILSYCDSLDANDITPILYGGNEVKIVEYNGSNTQTTHIAYCNIVGYGGRYFVSYKVVIGNNNIVDKTYELQYSNGVVSVKREISTKIFSLVGYGGNVFISNGNGIMKVTNYDSDSDFILSQGCPSSLRSKSGNQITISGYFNGVSKQT